MSVPLQDTYLKNITPPAVIADNTAITTGEIDTVVLGDKYDYLSIVVQFGAMDIAVTTMKVQESDTSGSGFADITGTVGGTSFTLPIATSDNGIYVFHLDLRKRKRYIDLSLTVGDGVAGTYVSVLGIYSRGKESPVGATAKGLAAEIIL